MQIARLICTFDSILEDHGQPAYTLDAYVNQDGETKVDVHQEFTSGARCFAEMKKIAKRGVIPVLSPRTGGEAALAQSEIEVGGA